ncbi:DUF3267 domain-containing protein [Halococcus salifodinae]|uniref:DUF3267 domain-containing protein n=1 Tax=Halococcus salifodinae DSM 8989 TaxID=1227456 RepID=M0MQA4_9EURY|nr:hypothetical protein C450_20896 [Halococcus salifodinae DSM 8989]
MTVDEWPPTPPEGYRFHDLEYNQPWYITAVLYLWLVGVFVGVPALVIGVHGPGSIGRIIREVLQPDTAREWGTYFGWIVGTFGVLLVGHEALHALAGRWFGLRTKVRIQYDHPLSWSPEILTYGEFQSRGESLAITLTPLVGLTAASIVVLVAGQHLWLIASAAVIALGNSASAIGDLGSAAVLWHLPDGELVYHDEDGRRQYYTPVR